MKKNAAGKAGRLFRDVFPRRLRPEKHGNMSLFRSCLMQNILFNMLNWRLFLKKPVFFLVKSLIGPAKILRNHGPGMNAVRYYLARWQETRNKHYKAAQFYSAGLARLDLSDSFRQFKCRQQWQFNLERALYMAGVPRVTDPLFSCRASPSTSAEYSNLRGNYPGFFEVSWNHHGLLVEGFAAGKDTQGVQIRLDSRHLLYIPVKKIRFISGFFHFHIKRDVVSLFPRDSEMQVCTLEGEPLEWQRSSAARLSVPHGSGILEQLLEQGATINKKGYLTPNPSIIRARQDRYLKVYEQARDFFDKHLRKALFLMYGTLLGYYRQGDFIEGDDDFDVGYVSFKGSVQEVREETRQMVLELIQAGFTVSFNRRGRLFRLRLKNDPPGCHLDVRPLWYEEGKVWAHMQACLPLSLDDFLPAGHGLLRRTRVYIPRNPESFLKAYYGPGWKVPDPGYSNSCRRPGRSVINKLNCLCIGPGEYLNLNRRVEALRKNNPEVGRLVSIGSQSLYPLDKYEAQ